ncbi:MAG: hypothetical protein IIA17_07235 [candidate division Zixibacteria bacterium]|nr:hypothetical protein [candidate division Zixibacteria bacterium]
MQRTDTYGAEKETRLEQMAKEQYELIAGRFSNYDGFLSLLRVKNYIRHSTKNNRNLFSFKGQQLGYFIFPFLIDMMLRHSRWELENGKIIDESELGWLIDKYINYPNMSMLKYTQEELNKFVPEELIRMSFEQFPLQESTRTIFPRYMFLYKIIPESDEKYRSYFKMISRVLDDDFELSLAEVFRCATGISAAATIGDTINENPKCEVDWLNEYVKSGKWSKVLNRLTIPISKYKEEEGNGSIEKYLNKKYLDYSINWYPIIETKHGSVAPYPRLIMERVTKRLYKDFYNYYDEPSGNDKQLKLFMTLYGDIFEEYIGILLRDSYGAENVFNFRDLPQVKGKRADWLVVHGRDLIVFECKAKRWPRKLKITGSLQILESFLNKHIGLAVEQCLSSFQYLQKNDSLSSSASRYNYVILIEDSFGFSNALDSLLEKNEVAGKLNNTNGQIMSLHELEILVSSNMCNNVESVFIKKLEDSSYREASFDNYFTTLKGFEMRGDSILDETFRDLFELPNSWCQ